MEMSQLELLKQKTILLVEDEMIIRDNIASMLKFFFKEVYTANDGYAGLESYQKYLPDIIMTDLKMPYMCGFDLIEELKKRASSSFMIVVSAHTDTKLLLNAVNNGIDRYIIKPFTEHQLFDAFEAYLDKTQNALIQLPDIQFNPDKRELHFKNKRIDLNNKETLLLKLLMQDVTKVFTYEEIENQVWGEKSMSLSSLRSVIRDIRKKTGQKLIQNVSGVGYQIMERDLESSN
jgi:two-component system response regulator VanR